MQPDICVEQNMLFLVNLNPEIAAEKKAIIVPFRLDRASVLTAACTLGVAAECKATHRGQNAIRGSDFRLG